MCTHALCVGNIFKGGVGSLMLARSLEAGHHVVINLHREKVYCLPDGYEVNDPSQDDIRYVLNPRYAPTIMFFKSSIRLSR